MFDSLRRLMNTWIGPIAWLNSPTVDGRFLAANERLDWQLAGGRALVTLPSRGHKVVVAGHIFGIEFYYLDAIIGYLELDEDVLASTSDDLYPEIAVAPSRNGSTPRGYVIGLRLGTNPAWPDLPPIVRNGQLLKSS